jgi:hypothetical protein
MYTIKISDVYQIQYNGVENFQELWNYCCSTIPDFGLHEEDGIVAVFDSNGQEVDLANW